MAPILPGHLRPPRAARRGRRAPPARRAPAGSGRTSSTSARARASTSSACLERSWPELLPEYERLYAGARLPARPPRRRPPATTVAQRSRAPHGIARPPAGPPRPPQPPSRARSSIAPEPLTPGATRRAYNRRRGAGRDHRADRRRPRGRPRGPPPLALARAAHPRRRRGGRRRRAPSSSRSAASPTS